MLELSRDELEAAGMRTFFRIANAWSLSMEQQMAILALSAFQLKAARLQQDHELNADTLARLSYVFRAFRAVNTLLPGRQNADRWLHKPNMAPLFEGRPAVDLMASGRIADLELVVRYLEGQCQ